MSDRERALRALVVRAAEIVHAHRVAGHIHDGNLAITKHVIPEADCLPRIEAEILALAIQPSQVEPLSHEIRCVSLNSPPKPCNCRAQVEPLSAARDWSGKFECKAMRTADPPQDCSWPTCGCDPYAEKVITALQESGALAGEPLSAALAQPEAPAMDAPTPCCDDCGLEYGTEDWLDTVLTREDWLKICPDGSGILCANCIVRRMSKLPGIVALNAYFYYGNEGEIPHDIGERIAKEFISDENGAHELKCRIAGEIRRARNEAVAASTCDGDALRAAMRVASKRLDWLSDHMGENWEGGKTAPAQEIAFVAVALQKAAGSAK